MIGRSRNRARQASTVSQWSADPRCPRPRSCAAPPQLEQAADHDDADQDHALRDDGEVRVEARKVMSVRMSCRIATASRARRPRPAHRPG